MNVRMNSLVLGIALTSSMAILVTGCNRPETVASSAATLPTTTVGTEIDDTVLTTKVKSALIGDQEVKGFDIKVETRKGEVQLSGFVDNQAQIDRAISVAHAVDGVKAVENGMTLKDGKVTVGNKVDDGIVTAKVKSALLADASSKSGDIAVVTRKGEVQLSGFIDNQEQIDHAIEVARAVEGVQSVVNEMSIKK